MTECFINVSGKITIQTSLLAHYMSDIYFEGPILSASGLVVLISTHFWKGTTPAQLGERVTAKDTGIWCFFLLRICRVSAVTEIKDYKSHQSPRQLSMVLMRESILVVFFFFSSFFSINLEVDQRTERSIISYILSMKYMKLHAIALIKKKNFVKI